MGLTLYLKIILFLCKVKPFSHINHNMRSTAIAILLGLFLFSCNNHKDIPDVSNIIVSLSTERFERKLFDTTAKDLFTYILQLQNTAPSFATTWLDTILNVDRSWPADTAAAY